MLGLLKAFDTANNVKKKSMDVHNGRSIDSLHTCQSASILSDSRRNHQNELES